MTDVADWIETASHVAIILGVVALAFSAWSYRSSVEYNQAQLFLLLRESFEPVHKRLVDEIPDFYDHDFAKSFEELEETQQEAIRSYWRATFNEWFATQKVYRTGHGLLWRDFYMTATASSLKHRPLREGVVELFESDHSLGQVEREFRDVIEQLLADMVAGKLTAPGELTAAQIEAMTRDLATMRSAGADK